MMKSIFLFLLTALLPCGTKGQAVGVVGLGGMGASIVKCYDQHGFEVHAWNRGKARREQVKDLGLKSVRVHDKLEDVVAPVELIIVAILGGADLKNAQDLVKSIPAKAWKGKTIMQYSAHEPVSAKEFEKLVKSVGGDVIAGAMIAEAEDVCSDVGTYFVASSKKATLEKFRPTLEKMGPLVSFDSDVGLASLADIGILSSVYFGITGLEMTLLLMDRYGAPASFRETFLELADNLVPQFFPVWNKHASHVMTTKQWTESVDRKDLALDLFDAWFSFMKKMGVAEDTFMHSYYKYVQRIPNENDAMSRWTEFAVAKSSAKEL